MITSPKTVLSLDLRSLSAFRIALATVVLVDLALRSLDLQAHYTDDGILPRAAFLEQYWNPDRISMHLASGNTLWIALLFVVAAAFALALLVGYRTRFVTVVCWFLLISLQTRNPRILHGGDTLLRMLLFWSMFLPLGARFSLDAALSRRPVTGGDRIFGGPTIAYTLQIALLYCVTAILKSGDEWWPDGTASYYALSLDAYTTVFGRWLSQFHDLLRVATYGTYFLEWAAAFLLLSPFFFAACRTFAVVVLAALHASFILTIRLNIFPWVDIVALIALVPGACWDWLSGRLATPERLGLRVYYDGECGFCRKTALIVKTFLLLPHTPVEAAERNPKAAEDLRREHSWVVVDSAGTAHYRWDAMVVLLEHSPWTGWLARRLPLRSITPAGDRMYRFVAERRDRLGAAAQRLLPERDPPATRPGICANVVTLALIVYVILWNLQTIPDSGFDMRYPWTRVANVLKINQKWNLFAPRPIRTDGWFVIRGTLRDGTTVDVYNRREGEVSWEKPELVSDTYRSPRWRKFLMLLPRRHNLRYRLYYGRYLCRDWNDDRPRDRQLRTFEIYFMREWTEPPGEPPKLTRSRIWRHNCFGERGKIRVVPPREKSSTSPPSPS